MIVASHNLMFGLRLERLLDHYRRLRDGAGLAVLCVQENEPGPQLAHVDRIARCLGPSYRAVWDREQPGMGLVFDGTQLELVDCELLALPNSLQLSWFDRTYLRGGRISPRFAQIATFAPRAGAPICVVNFHLTTGGPGRNGTEARRRQVDAIAAHLHERAPRRFIACGDTNAFWWRQERQPATLGYILEPLSKLGAAGDTEGGPTHYFGRQNEPKLTHQLMVLLGKLGVDLPQRYDVVCTDLPVTRRGHETTVHSDHDLVWAAIDIRAS